MRGTNNQPAPALKWRRWLVLAAHLVVMGVSATLSWRFGSRLSGNVLGAVLALNAAVFSSVVLDSILDRLTRTKSSDRARR